MNTRRRQHQAEVEAYLQRRFGIANWTFTLPRGSGHETYIAQGGEHALFVKIGTVVERTIALANIGLTPPVLQTGRLEDESTVVVQLFVEGHHPGRLEYRDRLENVARIVREMHCNLEAQATLPSVSSDDYASAGIRALGQVRARWGQVRAQVPAVAGFVEAGLGELEGRIGRFKGSGLVASHNDICWDNWLFAEGGRIYLVDLDDMSLDDPALDVGATLWWYYPPELWSRFLALAGYPDDEELRERMWTRVALHCLSITLPRPGSFDIFDPAEYPRALADFKAALRRAANPELS